MQKFSFARNEYNHHRNFIGIIMGANPGGGGGGDCGMPPPPHVFEGGGHNIKCTFPPPHVFGVGWLWLFP